MIAGCAQQAVARAGLEKHLQPVDDFSLGSSELVLTGDAGDSGKDRTHYALSLCCYVASAYLEAEEFRQIERSCC